MAESAHVAQWIKEAYELGAAGSYPEAAERYRLAVAVEPDNETALLGLGAASLYVGDVELARVSLEKLLAVNPGRVRALSQLAKRQRDRGDPAGALMVAAMALPQAEGADRIDLLWTIAHCHTDHARHAEARECVQQVLGLDPQNPAAHRYLAWWEQRAGNCQEALAHLRVVTNAWPHGLQLWLQYGELAIANGDPTEARRAVATAKNLPPQVGQSATPSDEVARSGYEIARLSLELPDPQLAIDAASIAIVSTSDRKALSRLHSIRARAFAHSSDVVRQRQDLLQALRYDPRNDEAHHGIGLHYLSSGDLSGALKHLGRAVRLAPESADYWYSLGYVAAERGRLSRARSALEMACSLDSESTRARVALVGVLYQLGETGKAIDLGSQIVSVAPTNPSAHYNLAEAYRIQGDHGHAIEHYRQAARLDPSHRKSLIGLGESLLESGRPQEAESIARGLEPTDEEGLVLMSEALVAQGRSSDALYYAENAVRVRPESAFAWVALAFARGADADPSHRHAALDRAKELSPADPWVVWAAENLGGGRRKPKARAHRTRLV